jgi:hypothetical protein
MFKALPPPKTALYFLKELIVILLNLEKSFNFPRLFKVFIFPDF